MPLVKSEIYSVFCLPFFGLIGLFQIAAAPAHFYVPKRAKKITHYRISM